MGNTLKKQDNRTLEEKAKDKTRAYNWGTIIYPESAPENFMDIINDLGVATAVSPLHDKDIDGNGEPKKPHFHVIMHFDSLKSRMQFKEVTSAFGGVGAESIKSMGGAVQYLAHMNSADKARYDETQIQTLCGFDIQKYMPKADNLQLELEILDLVEKWDITHLSQLQKFILSAIQNGELTKEHLQFLRSNSYYWTNILKSRTHEAASYKDKRNEHEREYFRKLKRLKELADMGFIQMPPDFSFDELDKVNITLEQLQFELDTAVKGDGAK